MSQDPWRPLQEQIERAEASVAALRRDRRRLRRQLQDLQRERRDLAERIRRLLQRLQEMGLDEQT